VINARIGKKTNNGRKINKATHYGRSQQKMMTELFPLFGQPNFSGDDMNIIQVGRPAVSRYHQTRRFFTDGLGYDACIALTIFLFLSWVLSWVGLCCWVLMLRKERGQLHFKY
jgi:hypothetical protein